jgi:hypothetical protein
MLLTGGFTFSYVIAADTTNFNLRSAALAAGWDGVAVLRASVTINAGIYVGSTSPATPAFDTGTPFPAGSLLSLVNNGFVVGKGGNAGNGGANSLFGLIQTQTSGDPGGPALSVQHPLTVINNGTIGGGGGGGGGGGYAADNHYFEHYWAAAGGGGGGGAGYVVSSGGVSAGNTYIASGGAGAAGTKTAGGAGGAGTNNLESTCSSGAGGVGGTLGQTGGTSGSGAGGTMGNQGGIAGGAPGNAVTGDSNVTWSVTGTRLGPIV